MTTESPVCIPPARWLVPLTLAVLAVASFGQSSSAWDNRVTHQRLTEAGFAGNSEQVDSLLRSVYGFEDGLGERFELNLEALQFFGIGGAIPDRFRRDVSSVFGDPAPTDSFIGVDQDFPFLHLLRAGLYAADNPDLRNHHHFHDPVRERDPQYPRGLDDGPALVFGPLEEFLEDLEGLFSQLIPKLRDLKGFSARDRALNLPPTDAGEPNQFSLVDAEEYLYRSLTERTPALRSGSMALHAIALGHAVHALQDMSSPPHTRNDYAEALIKARYYSYFSLLKYAAPAGKAVKALPSSKKAKWKWLDWKTWLGEGLEKAGTAGYIAEHYEGNSLEQAGATFHASQLISEVAYPNRRYIAHPKIFLAGVSPPPFRDPYDTSPYNGVIAEYRTDIPIWDPDEEKDRPIDLHHYWDSDDKGVTTGHPTTLGLAERVNAGFVSLGSMSNDPARNGYPSPTVPVIPDGSVDPEDLCPKLLPLRGEDGEAIYSLFGLGPVREGRFVDNELVPHLLRCRKTVWTWWATVPDGFEKKGLHVFTTLDTSVQRDVMEWVFPMGVDYTERFFEQYVAPRIDVIRSSPTQFRLANLTRLPFNIPEDGVEIVYDVDAVEAVVPDGTRARVPVSCSADLVLEPASAPGGRGKPSEAICTMPPSLPVEGGETLIPLDDGDFWIVARGKLGDRGALANRQNYDDRTNPRGFVTGVARVLPEIVYNALRRDSPDAEGDEEVHSELFIARVDPGESLPPSEPSPVPIPLSPDLIFLFWQEYGLDPSAPKFDMGSPSVDRRSGRIAFSADLEAVLNGVEGELPTDVWIYDASEQQGSPLTKVVYPNGTHLFGGTTLRHLAWNQQEEDDSIYFLTYNLQTGPEGPPPGHWINRYAEGATVPTSNDYSIGINMGAAYGARLATVSVFHGPAGTEYDPSDIWIVDPTTSEPRAAFNVEDGLVEECVDGYCEYTPGINFDIDPAYSPDGSKVAFVSNFQLYIADLEHDTIAPIPGTGGIAAVSPSWSPGGDLLAYVGEGGDIFVIPAVGGDDPPRRLTADGAERVQIDWMPVLALPASGS